MKSFLRNVGIIFPAVLFIVLALGGLYIRFGDKQPTTGESEPEIFIDNETPFIYDATTYNTYHDFHYYAEGCYNNHYDYMVFEKYMGIGIIRHFQSDGDEYYYSVYSLRDGYVGYLFLELADDGKYYIIYWDGVSVNQSWSWLKDKVFDFDTPAAILGNILPVEYTSEYYSADELRALSERYMIQYGEVMGRLGIYQDDIGVFSDINSVWRCIKHCYINDVIDPETKHSWQGIYVYDLTVMNDGTGKLHYRHYIAGYGYDPVYTLNDEALIYLDTAQISAFMNVVGNSDFWNTPTWNPEEETGYDGETTYLYGETANGHIPHMIAMWYSWERYGIYRIRTAIEDIVRSNVTVTSGCTYIDY